MWFQITILPPEEKVEAEYNSLSEGDLRPQTPEITAAQKGSYPQVLSQALKPDASQRGQSKIRESLTWRTAFGGVKQMDEPTPQVEVEVVSSPEHGSCPRQGRKGGQLGSLPNAQPGSSKRALPPTLAGKPPHSQRVGSSVGAPVPPRGGEQSQTGSPAHCGEPGSQGDPRPRRSGSDRGGATLWLSVRAPRERTPRAPRARAPSRSPLHPRAPGLSPPAAQPSGGGGGWGPAPPLRRGRLRAGWGEAGRGAPAEPPPPALWRRRRRRRRELPQRPPPGPRPRVSAPSPGRRAPPAPEAPARSSAAAGVGRGRRR
nr:basic proline-rich protein [Oryctolagus cuniculus]